MFRAAAVSEAQSLAFEVCLARFLPLPWWGDPLSIPASLEASLMVAAENWNCDLAQTSEVLGVSKARQSRCLQITSW